MMKETFLTSQWNNRFSLGLGFVFFSYSAIILLTVALSAEEAFTGLVLIGCMF